MSTKSKKQENVTSWILAGTAIISAIAALVSALYAGNANRKAEEANNIASEANRIAMQSNEINSLSVNPNINVNPQAMTVRPLLLGCKEGDQYQLWIEVGSDSTFSNSGGATTQIVDFSLAGTTNIIGGWLYQRKLWARQDGTEIAEPLPVNLPSESSLVLIFRAVKPLAVSNSLDEIQSKTSQVSNLIEEELTWVFVFANNEYVTIDTTISKDYNTNISFDHSCDIVY